jgi:hypothetical protein
MIADGEFKKADGSDTGGCVEVAALPDGHIQVRDTKNHGGEIQTYKSYERGCVQRPPGRSGFMNSAQASVQEVQEFIHAESAVTQDRAQCADSDRLISVDGD